MQSSKHSTEAAALAPPQRKVRRAIHIACLAALAYAGAAHADFVTSDGDASSGLQVDLECEDVIVNGTFTVSGSTFTNIRYLIINSGGVLNATDTTFAVAPGNVQNNGTINGASYVAHNPSCGGSTPPPAATPTPVPTNGPLGLALMGLLLGAALPAKRWLHKRRKAAR